MFVNFRQHLFTLAEVSERFIALTHYGAMPLKYWVSQNYRSS